MALIIVCNSWLAFDAGTDLSLNFKFITALCVTRLWASGGAITWAIITYWENGKWPSGFTIFMGAISGLVMITPAAEFINMKTSFCFDVAGATICHQALRIKFAEFAARFRWVDNGDTFATHCVGGFVGTIATGIFASEEVAAYDGYTNINASVFFSGNI